ncbi:hypothetical protein [Pseudomonas sp. S4_EA_1b]|uniref:hypothetical protein n=1 Tax=Pseudomonas sp. S4_EA_1b TaxID=2796960 RepID=UPI0018E5B7AE|nr:hypothetical protein [Pseudomonas sp. S4_EA_1b]EKT4554175.1 hypothetical protein [Pseudomonas putida]MBI6602662.1 hypothetical protein [Pseudomonas sp. S4_EA_1b]
MNLIRFLVLLFVFICMLVGCTIVIALLVLAIRFWPVLLILILTLALFNWLLSRIGIQVKS